MSHILEEYREKPPHGVKGCVFLQSSSRVRQHIRTARRRQHILTARRDFSPSHRFGTRFPCMSDAYDRELRQLARHVGEELGYGDFMHEGVYCVLGGPSFETIAECRMLRRLGADAVGEVFSPAVLEIPFLRSTIPVSDVDYPDVGKTSLVGFGRFTYWLLKPCADNHKCSLKQHKPTVESCHHLSGICYSKTLYLNGECLSVYEIFCYTFFQTTPVHLHWFQFFLIVNSAHI